MQQAIGRLSGVLYQVQERLEIAPIQCIRFALCPSVLPIKVHRTKHCTVAAGFPQFRNGTQHLCRRNFRQNVLAEILCHFLHFCRNRSVFRCQVCVVSAGIHNAKYITSSGKVKCNWVHCRQHRIGKVNGNSTAY